MSDQSKPHTDINVGMCKPVTIDNILWQALAMAVTASINAPDGTVSTADKTEEQFNKAKLAINKIVMDIIKRSEPMKYEEEPHVVDFQHGYNNGIEDYKDSLIETAHQYGLGEVK
jgi:soluble cytochrome b562